MKRTRTIACRREEDLEGLSMVPNFQIIARKFLSQSLLPLISPDRGTGLSLAQVRRVGGNIFRHSKIESCTIVLRNDPLTLQKLGKEFNGLSLLARARIIRRWSCVVTADSPFRINRSNFKPLKSRGERRELEGNRMRGRKPKEESHTEEFHEKLAAWSQMPESSRPSLRKLAE